MNTYGLIGYPLGHSFSRKFFTEKFAKEGIDAQYLNFEIPSIEEFPNIIKNNPTLKGLNVTIPYKQQVMQYLDDISEEAKAIGAVNVVKVEHLPGFDGKVAKDVKLTGHNSDVIGFVESIKPLLKPHHKKALILGTGGASKAIRYGLEKKLGIETLFVSRTALPIFGYFMDKVLADKRFPQYHGKYPTAKEEIPRDTYIGASVYVSRPAASTDSTSSTTPTPDE